MSKLGSKLERDLEAHILDRLASLAPGNARTRGEIERAIPDALRARCGAIRRALDGTMVFRDKVDLRARLAFLRRTGQIVMHGEGRNARYRLAQPAPVGPRPTP